MSQPLVGNFADIGNIMNGPDNTYRNLIIGLGVETQTSNRRVDIQNDITKQVDAAGSYFGMRSAGMAKGADGRPRLILNGKPIFAMATLDQGFWPDGLYTAPSDEALKYDIEMTKTLGFNMCRKHVKVEPERWYYWCDKLGLLVWQDMPSGDRSVAPGKGEIIRSAESARQFEQELKRMIDGRRNHPSIIMWIVFNEGWGQYDTARLTNWVKQHDPTRLVNCASGWNDMQVGDVHDIHVYPGPGSPDPEPRDHLKASAPRSACQSRPRSSVVTGLSAASASTRP